MLKLRQKIKPDLVLAPSSQDMHQDHSTIYREALRAFKKGATIWGYEHPWNNLTFPTHIFVKLSTEHMERKIRCLKEYKSQSFRIYMSEQCIRSIVCSRGAQLDIPCAEAFELVRMIY
jgi:LmbE family N-acetylglucosaminyl deacetylase